MPLTACLCVSVYAPLTMLDNGTQHTETGISTLELDYLFHFPSILFSLFVQFVCFSDFFFTLPLPSSTVLSSKSRWKERKKWIIDVVFMWYHYRMMLCASVKLWCSHTTPRTHNRSHYRRQYDNIILFCSSGVLHVTYSRLSLDDDDDNGIFIIHEKRNFHRQAHKSRDEVARHLECHFRFSSLRFQSDAATELRSWNLVGFTVFFFFFRARVAHNSARASCALFSPARKSSSIIQFSSFFFSFFFLVFRCCLFRVVIVYGWLCGIGRNYLLDDDRKKYASLARTQLATVKMLTLENLVLIKKKKKKSEVIMTTAIISFSAHSRLDSLALVIEPLF